MNTEVADFADSLLEPAAPSANPMVSAVARVAKVDKETHDTFTLTLAPDGTELAPFAPGQFSMLYMFGVGELPISISGDPGRPGNWFTRCVRSGKRPMRW